MECAVTYFNLGVRHGGGIGDILSKKAIRNPQIYWVRWITDMIFYITVILLLMNMINGVIVSTFSQIREESNDKEEDINNKCFICSIDRVEFEKRNIPYDDHIMKEHKIKNYINFLVNIKLMSEKSMDYNQFYINECIKNFDVACFPVSRALSFGVFENEGEDEGGSDDEESG